MRSVALFAALVPLAVAAGPASARPGAAGCAVAPLGSARLAYAAWATNGAVAYARPGGVEVARFGPNNANGYPTVFGVLGTAAGRGCDGRWYRVQLPVEPNGTVGWVRARAVVVERVRTRIVVDLSERRLWLYRDGRLVLSAPVGVGVAGAPIPTGARSTRRPSRYSQSLRSDRSTTIRVRTRSTTTARARTQPTLPFGLTGSCTRYQRASQPGPTVSASTPNTVG